MTKASKRVSDRSFEELLLDEKDEDVDHGGISGGLAQQQLKKISKKPEVKTSLGDLLKAHAEKESR